MTILGFRYVVKFIAHQVAVYVEGHRRVQLATTIKQSSRRGGHGRLAEAAVGSDTAGRRPASAATGRPRASRRRTTLDRRARSTYTVIWEEPGMHSVCFHYEFEHDGDGSTDLDADCGVPGCPSAMLGDPYQ